ncbi:MAG TPA: DUF1905 domain-containing protein [Vitreimonas sp.]|nr:DUF1905 domain-containing protein [Vitreimonas sp.]
MIKSPIIVDKEEVFTVKGEIELFPQKGGWFFVRVPKKYTELTKDVADRGLVAITATAGGSSWNTSLLPMGDGTHFIALPAKVRKKENLNLGDSLSMTFVLRDR